MVSQIHKAALRNESKTVAQDRPHTCSPKESDEYATNGNPVPKRTGLAGQIPARVGPRNTRYKVARASKPPQTTAHATPIAAVQRRDPATPAVVSCHRGEKPVGGTTLVWIVMVIAVVLFLGGSDRGCRFCENSTTRQGARWKPGYSVPAGRYIHIPLCRDRQKLQDDPAGVRREHRREISENQYRRSLRHYAAG